MAGLHFDITADNSTLMRKLNEARQGVRKTAQEIERNGGDIDAMFRRMTAAAASFAAGLSAKEFISQLIEVRGEFQKLEVAFSTMLGSKEKADALMREAVQLAATTPFDLQGVASGYKQLLAYGVAMEDVTETMTRLGNIAAGLSIPLNDLVYLYGTTRAQGRLYTQDFNQFTGRGIPMIRELSKEFGVAESEIKGMVEAGRVGFPEVQKVIENLTNEGGMFYNLMEEQSKTLSGQVSNLGDSIQQMFNEIGKSTQGVLSEGISAAAYLVENYEQVGKVLMTLVAAYGTYKAAVIATAAVHKLQFVAGEVKAFMELTRGLTLARKAQEAFNLAALKNPYVLVASAIAAAGVAIWQFSEKAKDTEEIISDLDAATSDYAQSVGKLTSLADRYDELSSKTDRTEAETEELRKTMGSLAASVPDAVSAFDEFGNVMSVNTDKIRKFDEAQKEALRLTLKAQMDEAQAEADRINAEIGKEREIFQKGFKVRIVNGKYETQHYTQDEKNASAKRATELYTQLEKVNASLTKAKELYDGITSDDTSTSETKEEMQDINALIAERTEKIKTLRRELADLRSGKTKSDDILNAIEGKEAELKSEISALEKLTGTKAGGTRAAKDTTYALNAESRATEMEHENTRRRLQGEAEVQRERKDGLTEYYALMRRMEDEEYRHEVENIERSRAEALKKAKGEDAGRINAAFDRQLSAAEQSWSLGIQGIDREEQNETYKRQLSDYKSFVEQYIRIAEERRDRLAEIGRAEKAGDITSSDAAQRRAETESIAKLDTSTLITSLGLSVEGISSELMGIVDGVIASGIDTIASRLPILTAELSRLEKSGADPGEIAKAEAAVNGLSSALSKAKREQADFGKGSDRDTSKTIDKWGQMENAMRSVNDMISTLDSSFGEMLGDAGKDAMDVMQTVMSSTMGILTAISTTATAASASVSAVEKASVILAVISAALQAVMAITNAIVRNTSETAKLKREIEETRKELSVLDKMLENQQRLYESKDGNEYWLSMLDTIKTVNEQIEGQRKLIEEQTNLRNKYTKGTDKYDEADSALDEMYDEMDEYYDKRNEIQEEFYREMLQTDLTSLSDSMAESLFDAFTGTFDDIRTAWDDTLDDMLRSMLQAQLSRSLEAQLKPLLDKAQQYMTDGILTDAELDSLIQLRDKIFENSRSDIDNAQKLAEILGLDTASQQAETSPFEAMSQDTADELNGRFTALQITSASIDGKMDVIADLNRQMAEKIVRSLEQTTLGVQATINILNEVRDINIVTSKYLPRLEKIERGIDTLVTKL